jgi:intron-binding protein aquarius
LKHIQELTEAGQTVTEEFNYYDTFLDLDHVKESFPDAKAMEILTDKVTGPFEVRIVHQAEGEMVQLRAKEVSARGPYAEDLPPYNPIRFTSTQVNAIRSGMNEGLTLIIGPPGTGKTDCAVQLVSNLYHNFPAQKILIVTHSNAALNDIFEKIMQRDIDPRHLLRLGSGEAELRDALLTQQAQHTIESATFSKQGRVQWCLLRRLQLLAQVQRLASSLSIPGDFGSNCETSMYFQKIYLQSFVERYYTQIQNHDGARNDVIQMYFPFHAFFSDAPQPLFQGAFERDREVAEGCFNHIRKMFIELADYRGFELLRTQALRADYLLTKQVLCACCTSSGLLN